MRPVPCLAALALAALAACNSNDRDEDDWRDARSMGDDAAAASDQVAAGGQAFAQHCARCHGDAGQGTDEAPPVVGAGALPREPRPWQTIRTRPFETALDVALFATENMPPKPEARAKVEEDDYWAILAFALHANGIELEEPLGPTNARSIVLHP